MKANFKVSSITTGKLPGLTLVPALNVEQPFTFMAAANGVVLMDLRGVDEQFDIGQVFTVEITKVLKEEEMPHGEAI